MYTAMTSMMKAAKPLKILVALNPCAYFGGV